MSIEAMAMAGVDYTVCGIDLGFWEQQRLEQPPPFLLAEPNSCHEVVKKDHKLQDIVG
ncbi:hypothetical protein DITRI_Ditri18aG0062500 [Diplodiscus trichospermus]